MVVPAGLHVKLICFLEVWDGGGVLLLCVDVVDPHRARLHHYVVQHAEDLRLEDGDEVF